MASIKEFSMAGRPYYERKAILEKYKPEPIPLGEIVYSAGDCWSCAEPVKVDKDNQELISICWNATYFETMREAELVNCRFHGEYGSYQERAARGLLERW